jgi:ribonuclease HI/pterin-4a-carbinolamine dehydratase
MWQTNENSIEKTFQFDSFGDAITFVNQVAEIANQENHHPKIAIDYSTVLIQSSTHSAGDTITEKDHVLANKIDELIDATKSEVKTSSESINLKEAKLYTDGGSRGNPGPSAIGYAILDMDDQVVTSKGEYIGLTTNNQAEYQGLQAGLDACKALNIREVHVYMDSLLVVNQMNGLFKVKNRDLWPIHQDIKDKLSQFSKVTFTHVPRELNKLADSLVNECLDAQ